MFALRRASGKAVFVADVEDGSVGVAIIACGNEQARVLISDRAALAFEERTSEQTVAKLMEALATCAEKTLTAYSASESFKKYGAPKEVYAIVHSPWTHIRTAQSETISETPQVATKEIIARLAKEALAQPSSLNSGNILDAGVLQVFLNGYPTGAPIGKKATRIGVSAIESDIDPAIRQGLTETLGRVLPGRTPSIRAGMRGYLSVLHEHLSDMQRCAIIDINTNTTTAFVVRREVISEEASVSEGIASVVKRSGSALPEEMFSRMRLLASDTCSTPACLELKDTLARIEPDLVKAYAEMFGKLASQRRLPVTAVVFVRDDFAPWLRTFFSRIDFAQFTATTQPFAIETLTPADLHDAVAWEAGARPDSGIAVASAYVNILHEA